jgi:ribonuclease D
MYSHSLRACCIEILGINLDKSEQVSDWHRRPLSPEQIDYAALDAEWTMKLYQQLQAMNQSITVNANQPVEKLLEEIVRAGAHRMALLRESGLANEYILEAVKIERLTKAIQESLKAELRANEHVASHKGEFGSAKIGRRQITEIDVEALRREFPDIAEDVIKPTVKIKDLEEKLQERGFDPDQIEEVLNRLKKTLGFSNPTVQLWPKYSMIYGKVGGEASAD